MCLMVISGYIFWHRDIVNARLDWLICTERYVRLVAEHVSRIMGYYSVDTDNCSSANGALSPKNMSVSC